MPIDVRRFGVGHRRPDGPPGTTGIEGQVIEMRAGRASIAELAFRSARGSRPHTNPNWAYFLVIEGGGWVGVGDERTRVTAGEAVVWPPDVLHGAWTDGSPMRAIVVEFAGADARPARRDGRRRGADRGGRCGRHRGGGRRAAARRATKGEGSLRPGPSTGCADEANPEGEPD